MKQPVRIEPTMKFAIGVIILVSFLSVLMPPEAKAAEKDGCVRADLIKKVIDPKTTQVSKFEGASFEAISEIYYGEYGLTYSRSRPSWGFFLYNEKDKKGLLFVVAQDGLACFLDTYTYEGKDAAHMNHITRRN